MSENATSNLMVCGHPLVWENTFFDAARMVHCVTCLREGAASPVQAPVMKSPAPAPVVADKPAEPAVEIPKPSALAQQVVPAPKAKKVPTTKGGKVKDLSPLSETEKALLEAGGKVFRNVKVRVPRTKPWKDMTPEEQKAHKSAYMKEYNRIKREQKGAEAHREKVRAYQREYYDKNRSKAAREQADGKVNESPAPVFQAPAVETVPAPEPQRIKLAEPVKDVVNPADRPMSDFFPDFVVYYDHHGVAQWLPGETRSERERRRALAREERIRQQEEYKRRTAIGRITTPGEKKMSAPEREEARVKASNEHYMEQYRLRAAMIAEEAEAAGKKPDFSHGSLEAARKIA